MTHDPTQSSLLANRYAQIVLISLAVVFVYSNIFSNELCYDDIFFIKQNPWIREPGSLKEIVLSDEWGFTPEISSHYYRPLHHLAYIVLYRISGENPRAYRVASILLHLANSIVLFLIAGRIMRMIRPAGNSHAALYAGLIFAVHPVHTEAVAWASGFPDLSYASFGLCFLLLHMSATRWWSRVAAVLFLLLALFSKESAVMLVVIALAYDVAIENRSPVSYRMLKRYTPYVMCLIGYNAVRMLSVGGFAPHGSGDAYAGPALYANIVVVLAGYLKLLFLPLRLSAFHPYQPVQSFISAPFAVSFVVVTLYVLSLIYSWSRRRDVFFALLVASVPLFPALYLPALSENVVTERNLYMPSAGFALLAAVGISEAMRFKRRAVVPVLACTAVLAAFGTYDRNRTWRNDIVLWNDAVEKSDGAYIPLANLGLALKAEGRGDEAMKVLMRARNAWPNRPGAHTNLGILYYDTGDYERAVESFLSALELDLSEREIASIALNLGLAYRKNKELDKSIEAFRRSLSADPDNKKTHNSLANSLIDVGRYEDGLYHYERALEIDPTYQTALKNYKIARKLYESRD